MKRRRIKADPVMDALLGSISLNTALEGGAPENEIVLQGKVSLNHRGFAFVTIESGESYFVHAGNARPLLTGDIVDFTPVESALAGGNMEARSILRVVRAESMLLCEYRNTFEGPALVADEPCFIPLQLSGEKPALGEVVAVRIPAYEGQPVSTPMTVSVLHNLGKRTRENFDLDYAMLRYGFHETMPAHIAEEAQAGSGIGRETADAWTEYAGVPFVTIDGESTRDFDDALFAKKRPEGGWEVLVAVSDVSWYVQPGTELDEWARQRCTSLYLPGRTEPMLPECLSTDRCSLTPGELKRAVVMELILDAEGNVVSHQIRRSLIQSAARLTYNQVAAFMAGKAIRFAQPVEANLWALADVYAVLSSQREKAGRLEFEDPEPTLVPNGEGGWKLTWETRNDAHKVVEEMMLLANRMAAATLVQRYGAGLFRHQPPPDAEAWSNLRVWAQRADQELPDAPCMRSLASLAASLPSGDAQAAAALRIRSAMQPAKYVVNDGVESGHFSLSVNWYTHFTSPIRRYADLLVHRLLLAPEGTTLSDEEWDALSAKVAHCSERAHAARMAERLVWDRLKLKSFLDETPKNAPVRARIVRSAPRGLRLVIQGWQCSAWLASEALRAKGYSWTDDGWTSPVSAEHERTLTEGYSVTVCWKHLSTTRPAYPELLVELVTEES